MGAASRGMTLGVWILVIVATVVQLAQVGLAEVVSAEVDIRVPTWEVKHDIGPSGPVTDLHCDVGDVRMPHHKPLTQRPGNGCDACTARDDGMISFLTPSRVIALLHIPFRALLVLVLLCVVSIPKNRAKGGKRLLKVLQLTFSAVVHLQIEKANTVQLYGILDELVNTTYFRLFQINLEGKCK